MGYLGGLRERLTQQQANSLMAAVAWAGFFFIAAIFRLAVIDDLIQMWRGGDGAQLIAVMVLAGFVLMLLFSLMVAIYLSVKCFHTLKS